MGVQFDGRISLGNVITAGALAITVAIAWGKWTTLTETISDKLTEATTRLEGHEARIRVMETTTARQDERMILILDSLREIKARLEKGAP
ncbi:hypothetical protein JWJ88_17395 [Paracoccus methylovorus]|uniref:Uncharacterized protein n=1 Tax=Paracoccus methylovorus TaxID=2812658 RepID=A0ABX7JKG9_9RHOB|nr:hypothetical protein [Paracoccus methylovorus]QRZ14740.1 hypothetical protein JWJ88_17395 [Paracoccus methylovorus]